MKKIALDESIYELVTKYPEIKNILFELGFEDIIKSGMIQTVGKFMNLKKGAILKKTDLTIIIKKMEANGFQVEDSKESL